MRLRTIDPQISSDKAHATPDSEIWGTQVRAKGETQNLHEYYDLHLEEMLEQQ